MMKFNNELLEIYKAVPLRYKLYTIIRYAICPFDAIERYIPDEGKILDVGCGHGIFANLLSMKSEKRYIVGIDIMESKIKVANSTISGRDNIEFKVGDAVGDTTSSNDLKCIIFIDILCYIPFEKKKEILKRLYSSLCSEGSVIIKSMQEQPWMKYLWMMFHMAVIDKFIHGCFEKNSYFLGKKKYISLLQSIGFEVKFEDISKGYPYPHCLYICNKK